LELKEGMGFPAVEMDEEEGEQFHIFDFDFDYSGFNHGQIVVWTPLDSKDKTRILNQHSRWGVESLSFSPDGRFLESADGNGKFIIWATEVSKKTESIKSRE
jgi:WD40 repeat protein